jgi:hypothetical protein
MFDYEFNQVGASLEEVKTELKEYLVSSYGEVSDDPVKQADKIFKSLESQVDRIIKRKSYTIQFREDGSPMWHANIFKHLSQWISLEFAMCEMLSKEMFKLDD